jgi:site-specific recombinase XerD
VKPLVALNPARWRDGLLYLSLLFFNNYNEMKKANTLVQQAIEAVPAFGQSYEKFRNQMLAEGKSVNSISNYGRKIATLVLRFGVLPETLSTDQVNMHLAEMRVKGMNTSLSEFKHTIYGLRSYHQALGIGHKAARLPSIRKESRLPVVLSQAECRRLFSAPSLHKHRVLLGLVYSAGLRMSELRSLRIEDIDSDRMMLHIRAGKTRKDRYVPLAGCLLAGLRKYYLESRPRIYLFNGQRPGSPMSDKGVGWIMREAVKKAGIRKHATLHTLRHSYATHLLEMGMDILRVKELLGHSRILTTMIYLHVIDRAESRAFSPLDRLYPSASVQGHAQ